MRMGERECRVEWSGTAITAQTASPGSAQGPLRRALHAAVLLHHTPREYHAIIFFPLPQLTEYHCNNDEVNIRNCWI